MFEKECVEQPSLPEVDVQLFNDPTCNGELYQNSTTKPTENKATADFFMKSENPNPWSVRLSKEGYKEDCITVGVVRPFTENIRTVKILKNKENEGITPETTIDFSFSITNQLLPDVFVWGLEFKSLSKVEPCTYASWDTDPAQTTCTCKGMIGTGMNFITTTTPNTDNPHGQGLMKGVLLAMQWLVKAIQSSIFCTLISKEGILIRLSFAKAI